MAKSRDLVPNRGTRPLGSAGPEGLRWMGSAGGRPGKEALAWLMLGLEGRLAPLDPLGQRVMQRVPGRARPRRRGVVVMPGIRWLAEAGLRIQPTVDPLRHARGHSAPGPGGLPWARVGPGSGGGCVRHLARVCEASPAPAFPPGLRRSRAPGGPSRMAGHFSQPGGPGPGGGGRAAVHIVPRARPAGPSSLRPGRPAGARIGTVRRPAGRPAGIIRRG